MIVVAIIGILAAIAIPNFLKFQAKSKQSEAKSNLGAIFTGQVAYLGEANAYGDFAKINWSPSGTPRYHYQLAAYAAVDSITQVGNDNVLTDPTSWTVNNLNGITDNSATTTLTKGVVPMFGANTFAAGATGYVSSKPAGAANLDAWEINEKRQLLWIQDGI
jgi:type IV pilus assembly protein PilA